MSKETLPGGAILLIGALFGIGLTKCGEYIKDSDPSGRGAAIEACPVGYEPETRVIDETIIMRLGEIAERHSITDDFIDRDNSSQWFDDANNPGELECSVPDYTLDGNIYYLLPAGEAALARLTQLEEVSAEDDLPTGLVSVKG